jgi:putative redox protein
VALGAADFPTTIQARTHVLQADEAFEKGGSDTGPEPFELLLGSLGACTAITIRMYARRKGWAVHRIDVHLGFDPDQPSLVHMTVTCEGDLTEEQRTRLLQIGQACPVHKALGAGLMIATEAAPPR